MSLLFTIVVLLFSLGSWIAYSTRRGESKTIRTRLLETGASRALTPEENEALQPYLINPLNGKEVRLDAPGVFLLRGEYARHGLSYQGGETLHDTIGGLEVFFPYDAAECLAPFNTAEVVLTSHGGLVIRLNDAFHLPDARDRALARHRQDVDSDVGEVSDAMIDGAPDRNEFALELLGERDESDLEWAQRRVPGRFGLAFALAFPGLMVILFDIFDGPQDHGLGPIVGSSLIAFGLVAAMLRRSPSRDRVKRLSGVLTTVPIPHLDMSTGKPFSYFLGQTQKLTLPRHWVDAPEIRVGDRVEVEVRATDGSVVRFGRRLSVEREQQVWPLVFLEQPSVLTALGAIFLLLSWVLSFHPAEDDAAAAVGLFVGHDHDPYTSLAQFEADPPGLGDRVRFDERGFCELRLPEDGSTPVQDCSRVRVWGRRVMTGEPAPDESLMTFMNSGFLKEQRSLESLRAALLMRLQGRYTYAPTPVTVGALDETVRLTGAACERAQLEFAKRACEDYKDTLADVFADGGTWSQLKSAVAGTGASDSGVLVPGDTISHLKAKARIAGDALIGETMRVQVVELIKGMQGGVVVLHPTGSRPTPVPWLDVWTRLKAQDTESDDPEAELAGRVISADLMGDERVVSLAAPLTEGSEIGALMRFLVRWLGLVLFVFGGVLVIMRLREYRARDLKLCAEIQGTGRGVV